MTGSGLLASDYTDPTASTAAALGAGNPLGGSTPDGMAKLRAKYAAPQSAVAPAAPKETNLDIARRQREAGENPSRDPAAQNPHSSAGGANQIIDGTWLDLMNRYHPELTEGKSPEQIKAMKLDPALNDEMAHKYDRDNAKVLAQNGIAPTPNFINALYRAGPNDGLKLIAAARENPSALVKDIAPALATPGNNGAGNLTVGQFLVNPYARGPGGQEDGTPQQMFTLARGNQILQQQLADFQSGRERVQEIDKDYKPLEIGKPPKPPETDPLKQFSSVAGLFATIAAGFSRTPAIAAMNGLAGAMNAAKKSDWDTYQAQYDQFKTNSELAIKAHQQHSADIKDALEMMTKNMAAGKTMLDATIALSDDEQAQKHAAVGDFVALDHLRMERDQHAAAIAAALPVTLATVPLTAALQQRSEAIRSGDPDAVKAADALVTQAENHLAEVKRAEAGGAKTTGLGNPFAAMVNGKQTMLVYDKNLFVYKYPDGTPVPQDATIVPVGKSDAPDVAAHKTTLETERARHDFEVERIANDRELSAGERFDRQQSERERHDSVMEKLGQQRVSNAAISGLVPMLVNGKQTEVRYNKATAQVEFPDGTPVPPGTTIAPSSKVAAPGSPGEERTRRFNEMKSAQQSAGTYTNDTAVYRALDHQMAEDRQTAISDEAAKTAADIALKTGHPPAWMGRSQASLTKFLDVYSTEAKRLGLGPDEIAANQVKFAGELAEARTLGTMSARVDFGAKELDVALPQAMEASERVYRPGFKKIAEIQQAVQGQTSDPDLLEFAQFNQQVISAYAQMMGRGGLSTVHAMDRAEGLLSTATSQAGYMRQLDTLHKEVQIILYGTQAAKDQLRQEIGGNSPVTQPPTLSGVPREGAQASPTGGITPPTSLAGKNLQWSPSLKQWRDKDSGVIYNADGTVSN